MTEAELIYAARDLAESHLAAALPRRWRHVQAVALNAAYLASTVAGLNRRLEVFSSEARSARA